MMNKRERAEMRKQLVKVLGEPTCETQHPNDKTPVWTWEKQDGFNGETETFSVNADFADAHYTMSIGETKIEGRAELDALLGKAFRCRHLRTD